MLAMATLLVVTATSRADYGESFNRAQREHRPLLVVFHAAWCGPCKVMMRETWGDQKFMESLDKYETCFVDVDKEPEIWKKYQATFPDQNLSGIPAHAIIDMKAKVKTRLRMGYISPKGMLEWIRSR